MRPIQWHLKNNWRVPESLEKVNPIPRSLHPHLPSSKEGWGAHLNERTARGSWSLPETAHKLSPVKSSLLSSKRVPRPLYLQDGTSSNRQHYSSVIHSNRQHYSSVIHKQGGRHEVVPTLCPSMENLDLVHQSSSNSQSPTHPRPAECGSRQAITSRPDHSNRMVPPSRGFPVHMQQVAPAKHRPICHEVQQQITSVCVTSTGPPGHCSGRPQSAMGGSGRLCLPTSSHLG